MQTTADSLNFMLLQQHPTHQQTSLDNGIDS